MELPNQNQCAPTALTVAKNNPADGQNSDKVDAPLSPDLDYRGVRPTKIPCIREAGSDLRKGLVKGFTPRRVQELQDYRNHLANLKGSEGLSEEDVADYIPYFHPDIFTRQFLEDLGLTPFHQANLLSIIGFVRHQEEARKYIIKRNKNGNYARIKLVALTNCITALGEDALRSFLDKLELFGLLEIDRKFEIGVQSYGYRIGLALQGTKWKTRNFHEVLMELIWPQDRELRPSRRSRTLHRAYNLWDRVQLFFTYSGPKTPEQKSFDAATHAHLMKVKLPETAGFHELLDDCAQTKGRKNKKEGKGLWYEELKEIYLENAAAINRMQHYIKYDRITNRQFTRLSNLKSELRDKAEYEGEKMVNCDFTTCQPALFSSFYADSPEDLHEKEEFIRVIQSEKEDIYEKLAAGQMKRPEAKKAVFLLSFGEIRQQRGICLDNFKRFFPILINRIIDIKRAGTYKSVSRAMQTVEAKIMVSNILPTLIFKHQIPAFGIHDSVMCRPRDLETVKSVMSAAFEKEMGFSPRMKVTGNIL